MKGEVSNNPLKSDEISPAQKIIMMKKVESLRAWDQLKAGQLFEKKIDLTRKSPQQMVGELE